MIQTNAEWDCQNAALAGQIKWPAAIPARRLCEA